MRGVGSYDELCDEWSLGCLLLHMLTGEKPGTEQAALKLTSCEQPAVELILSLLEPDKERRITASAALSHPWLN